MLVPSARERRTRSSGVGLRVLEQEAGVGAHAPVGADEVGLSGLAEPLALPLAPARHDAVDLGYRDLHGQDPDEVFSVEDRSRRKGCRRGVGGPVALEVHLGHEIAIRAAPNRCDRAGEVAARVGTVDQVRPEVHLLRDGVDQIARFGVHEEDVVVAEARRQSAEEGVEAGVRAVVGGRDPRQLPGFRLVEALLLPDRVRIRDDVAVLDHPPGRPLRQVALEHGLALEVARETRHELVTVEGLEARVPGARRPGPAQLAEGLAEAERGRLDRVVLAEGRHLTAQPPEVGLDLVRLRGAQARQMVERRALQRRLGVAVAEPRDDPDRHGAHAEHHHEELRLDAEAAERRQTSSGGREWDGRDGG
jgi:hypothetical protein